MQPQQVRGEGLELESVAPSELEAPVLAQEVQELAERWDADLAVAQEVSLGREFGASYTPPEPLSSPLPNKSRVSSGERA